MSPDITHNHIRAATLEARQRTGDSTIGVSVRAGLVRVEHLVPRGSGFDVLPVTGFLPMQECLAYLNGMQATGAPT